MFLMPLTQMFLKMVGKTKHRVERLNGFVLFYTVLLNIAGKRGNSAIFSGKLET